VAPLDQQLFKQSFQQSLPVNKMSAHNYRKLFTQKSAPINVSVKANNVVFQVQKVDKIQHLMSTGNDGQSSVLSPMFNVVDFRVAFVSTKDKNS